VNPGELVQAVLCTQETHKNPCDHMTLIFKGVAQVHVHAKCYQAKCSSSWVDVANAVVDIRTS